MTGMRRAVCGGVEHHRYLTQSNAYKGGGVPTRQRGAGNGRDSHRAVGCARTGFSSHAQAAKVTAGLPGACAGRRN